MSDHSESNRKIAEALGWHAFDRDSPSFSGYLHEPSCTRRKYGDKCFCTHEDNPDFYCSEEANALVRDAILAAGFMIEIWPQPYDPDKRVIVIMRKVGAANNFGPEWGRGHLVANPMQGICEAYLAMLEEEK